MEIDFASIAPRMRYKLLASFVIPRPIALVTTVDDNGSTNAAPFSFFNVFGEDPALVVLGFDRRSDGTLKDTVRNILDTGEFVVNMVDEPIAKAMNDCAVDFPRGVDELEVDRPGRPRRASWSRHRGSRNPLPRSKCRHLQSIQFKPHRMLVMGEVVWMRAKDHVIDAEKMRVIDDAYRPVGRLYADLYARQSDRFSLVRQTYDEWLADQKEG